MDDALGAQACLGFREVVFDSALSLDPVDIAGDSFFDRGSRFVADCADAGYIGDQRTNLAGAKLASRKRFEVDAELVCDDRGQITHAGGTSAADVGGQAIERVGSGCEQIGAGDVLDEAEVAGLAAIFIEDGGLSVQQARAEDGDDARIGIEE